MDRTSSENIKGESSKPSNSETEKPKNKEAKPLFHFQLKKPPFYPPNPHPTQAPPHPGARDPGANSIRLNRMFRLIRSIRRLINCVI